MFRRIDHIAIVVRDIQAALGLYRDAYGLPVAKIETYPEVQAIIAFIPLGEVLIELIQPTEPGQGPVGDFLEKNGEGFHHLALRVDDLAGEMKRLAGQGLALQDREPRPGSEGSLIAFLDSNHSQNVLTELVEREQEPFDTP